MNGGERERRLAFGVPIERLPVASYCFLTSPTAELRDTDGVQWLRISTYAYEFPEATNPEGIEFTDADWHLNMFEGFVNGSRWAAHDAILRGFYVERVVIDLEALLHGSQDTVVVAPYLKPYFKLTIHRIGTQRFSVSGFVRDIPEYYADAESFDFEADVVGIRMFTDGLRRILRHFPAR